MGSTRPKTVAAYIAAAPKEARPKLRELRAILKQVAPKARQTLKWGAPVFEEHRILFAYAAFKTHLNFMPTPSTVKAFRSELEGFKTGKGSIQFPYEKSLPKSLIKKIAAFRVKELRENDVKWM